MKKGLVLEGGGLRGIFSAGVLDVFMENGIEFDNAVGTSAGAAFGCNIKSRQIGRAVRYNKQFANDKRYCSIWSLLTTGDIFNKEFCYHQVPMILDPFDGEACQANPMEFYAVATDIDTAEPVYLKIEGSTQLDMEKVRASASMPAVSTFVELDGKYLLDGGMTDSIPIKFSESLNNDKIVVVLTQEYDYVKKPAGFELLFKWYFRKHPKGAEAMKVRHIGYNEMLNYVKEREAKGEIFVIRPDVRPAIGRIEHDPEKIQGVYDQGRRVALERLEDLKKYLEM